MMLHGMCGDALRACERLSDAGRDGTFLVCPAGNVKCGGYDDWQGAPAQKASALDEAMESVDRAFGAGVDHAAGDVLIGFSRGACVARDAEWKRRAMIGCSFLPRSLVQGAHVATPEDEMAGISSTSARARRSYCGRSL